MKLKYKNINFKITLIDTIFLMVGLLITAVIFLYFMRQEKEVVVRFRVTDDNPLYAYTNPTSVYSSFFKVGDKEYSEIGKVTAEIVNVYALKTNSEQTMTLIDVKLKSIYNPRKKIHFFKGRPLVFGERHIFEFSEVKTEVLSTEIVSEQKNENPSSTKEIKVSAFLGTNNLYNNEVAHFAGIPPYLSDKIEEAINNKESLIGFQNISDIQITNSKIDRVVQTDQGALVYTRDPYFEQIKFTITLEVDEVNGEYYLMRSIPIKVGSLFPLNWKSVQAFPIVTNIEEI